MSRLVCVRRVMTAEYSIPIEQYKGMGDALIVAFEKQLDPQIAVDHIVSEDIKVWFEGDA